MPPPPCDCSSKVEFDLFGPYLGQGRASEANQPHEWEG